MMDWNFVMQLINMGLFPIVACIAMALFFKATNDNYRNHIKEMTNNHKTEIENMSKALQDNTMAIQRLVDHLEKED
jgi:hypothetical protein